MSKKIIIAIVVIIAIIVFSSLMINKKSNNNEESNDSKTSTVTSNVKAIGKSYIHFNDDLTPGSEYEFEMNDDCSYKITVKKFSSTLDGKTATISLSGNFDTEEQEKVNKIIEFLSKNSPKDESKNDYYLYINESLEDAEINSTIDSFLRAIESVAKNNEIVYDSTKGEYDKKAVQQYDLNNDKVVTAKEFGINYLNTIVNNMERKIK